MKTDDMAAVGERLSYIYSNLCVLTQAAFDNCPSDNEQVKYFPAALAMVRDSLEEIVCRVERLQA